MTALRKRILVALIVASILSIIGATIYNTTLVYSSKEPDIDAPLLAPVPAAIYILGVVFLISAIVVGWNNQGSLETETQPSREPKSLVLKMPRDTREKGKVTLVVRNGDHHEFLTEPEIMRKLIPGMIGIATILDHDLLDFEPDKEQPNIKKRSTETNLEEKSINQP